MAGILLRTLSTMILGRISFWEIQGKKFLSKLNNGVNSNPRKQMIYILLEQESSNWLSRLPRGSEFNFQNRVRYSQVALVVKNPPVCAGDLEMRGQSLSWNDPLEKDMATHSIILVWRIPQTEEPGGLQSLGLQRVRHNWTNLAHTMMLVHKFLCLFFQVA